MAPHRVVGAELPGYRPHHQIVCVQLQDTQKAPKFSLSDLPTRMGHTQECSFLVPPGQAMQSTALTRMALKSHTEPAGGAHLGLHRRRHEEIPLLKRDAAEVTALQGQQLRAGPERTTRPRLRRCGLLPPKARLGEWNHQPQQRPLQLDQEGATCTASA